MMDGSKANIWEGTVEGLDCADCAATLAKEIEKLRGVKSVSLSFATSKLRIEYDPGLTGERQIASKIGRSGYKLVQSGRYSHVVLAVEGMDCPEESTIIEKQLRKLPGIEDVQFNLIAQEVRVRYDSVRTGPDQMIQAVSRAGMKGRLKGRKRPVESFWQRRKQLVLTALSGGFILAALGFSWAGYPHRITDPLYVAAIVMGGYFIARRGFTALMNLSLDMNFLMTVAVAGAAVIEQWLEGATVMFLFSVANLLQNYTMDRARNAIRSLMDLSPREVTVKRKDREEKISPEEVRLGETIIIRPGEKIGLDGRVADGNSWVNQAPITGESMPVAKQPGDPVFAGTINQKGSLEVEVTHVYQDTTLSRIIHMVEEAQAQKAPSQSFVDEFARYYTPIVIAGAALVAVIPPLAFGYPFDVWFYRSLVLLVIACPCALVISTPVSIVSALSAAARMGILIKGGVYLEEAGALKAVAFDKTGTLTEGVPRVTDVIALNKEPLERILGTAAAIEYRSEHPLGLAIVEEAGRRGLEYPKATGFQSITGKGAKARVGGKTFYIGSHRLCEELGKCSLEIESRLLDLERQKKTAVILASEDRALGIIAIADQVRAESPSAIEQLKAEGVEKVVMLTGDSRATAEAIKASLPIDEYHAELLPEDKASIVRDLMERYGKVAMVGDGVNDAPSMAVASVGIAMGTIGTDTALETADIALMTDDLSRLPFVIRLSRKTLGIIKQNITLALLTKAVFIGLAIPGLATLWMAVGADMGASLLVIFNGLRLMAPKQRRIKPV